jgi:hypothetical protein
MVDTVTVMTFEDWLVALSNIARLEGCSDYVADTGHECWEDAFNMGLTPEEAWADEKDAAHALGCF